MSWVSKLRHSSGAGGGVPVASDPDWLSLYPALHEFLTLASHDDGSVRRTSTITLFVDTGSWKAFLNERDSSCSLCASGPNIPDTLSALEVLLESENPPWRFSGAPAGPQARKKKPGS